MIPEGEKESYKGTIDLKEFNFYNTNKPREIDKEEGKNYFPKLKIKHMKKSMSRSQSLHFSANPNDSINQLLDREYIRSQGLINDNIYGFIMANKVKEFYKKKKSLGYSYLVSLKNNKYASGLKEKLQMMKFTK